MNERRILGAISAYRLLKKEFNDTWLMDCAQAEGIHQAIELAAGSRNFAGKKHPHQFRIPTAVLNAFTLQVHSKSRELPRVGSFDELLEVIFSCRVKGISDLTIYDTAQRLGFFLGLYPVKVYLHRGTRIGAERLLGRIKGRSIEIIDLPAPFQNGLSASEIEDILCIYKDRMG